MANYGIGANAYQHSYLRQVSGLDVTKDNLLELRRLCRIDPRKEDVYLSQFLSKCHKELKQRGYRYVVSFSDPYYGHSGGIYKASNFQYLGKTNAEYHVVDAEGNIRHKRYPKRYAERHGVSIKEARDILGLTIIRTPPKDRWFIKV